MTNERDAAAAGPDRKSVRKFFSFAMIEDNLEKKGVGFGAVFGWVLVGAIGGFLLAQGLEGGIGGGACGAAFGLLIDRMRAASDLSKRQRKLDANRAEFGKLALETRRVQGSDLVKTILRVFRRTNIDPASLRRLDNEYVFQDEKQLLDEKSREREFAELSDRSIRLISRGDFANKALRMVRFDGSDTIDIFYNPTRLVLLFLTETQLVICDVQFDSMDGNLHEEIQRVALSKIVNVHFIARRQRITVSRDELVRIAKDLRFEPGEIESIRAGGGSNEDWAQDEITSILNVSRTDGGSITMPIRSDIVFGRHRSALDDDSGLNEHEIKVDMMINELNRLVNPG